jgi:predicted nucleic acid-binding protein
MRAEIQKHKSKLRRLSKLSDLQLDESLFALYNRITFINENLIPRKIWEESEHLVKDIDIDDIDFIALTKHLKATLWTGDKALYLKLQKKGFDNILTTSRLLEIKKKLLT